MPKIEVRTHWLIKDKILFYYLFVSSCTTDYVDNNEISQQLVLLSGTIDDHVRYEEGKLFPHLE
jgi:hypothetical protein